MHVGEPVLHEISGIPTTDRRWANGFLAVTDMRLIFIVPTFSTWLAPELSLLAIEYVHAASPWLPTQVAGVSLPGVIARPSRRSSRSNSPTGTGKRYVCPA